jgi:hypothetical protein
LHANENPIFVFFCSSTSFFYFKNLWQYNILSLFYSVWERSTNCVSQNFKIIFVKKYFFICFKSFWCVDLKNNFLKIKKNIILMHFGTKSTLKSNRNHTLKQARSILLKLFFYLINYAINISFPFSLFFFGFFLDLYLCFFFSFFFCFACQLCVDDGFFFIYNMCGWWLIDAWIGIN